MKLAFTISIQLLAGVSVARAGLRHNVGHVRSVHSSGTWSTFEATSGGVDVVAALEAEEQKLEEEEASINELVQALEALETGMSMAPTAAVVTVVPTPAPTLIPTPMQSSPAPSSGGSVVDTVAPTVPVTGSPTAAPTVSAAPSTSPTIAPTFPISANPTISPAPTTPPTAAPTVSTAPSTSPTLPECGITPEERRAGILGILDQVADSNLIRDDSTPQGQATEWLISDDARRLCPDELKIVQRWVLAVMYFSTGGDSWFQCFDGDLDCGDFLPFVGDDAFLSSSNECVWAGISCNADACVTEIEFEENNLAGTIPTELGLLDELVIWGMERGNLTGTIPTEIGGLEKLIFIDLDFNELTGSLPTELYNLVDLTQLDLNNNFLSGDVSGLGVFTKLEFLQLHSNLFTGTIPDALGTFTLLSTFTLHEANFIGSVPSGLCDLVDSGMLTSLIADCGGDVPEISCECCSDCRE